MILIATASLDSIFLIYVNKTVRLIRVRCNLFLESIAIKIPEHEAYIHFRQVGQFFIIIFHRNTPNGCTINSLVLSRQRHVLQQGIVIKPEDNYRASI